MNKKKEAGWKLALAELFHQHHRRGARRVAFSAEDLAAAAHKHSVRNQYDIVYNSRSRAKDVPASVRQTCPSGCRWIIESAAKGSYEFVAVSESELVSFEPRSNMVETKVLNATPEIIAKYAKRDEQAALAIVRYNRLVDVFTGVTAYSLQSHLKTEPKGMAQVEVDELYLGIDSAGRHYAIPIEAKAGSDTLNARQIKQNIALCERLFPELIARPIGVKITKREEKHGANVIAMMEFEQAQDGTLSLRIEKHYKLVARDGLPEREMMAQNATPPSPRI